MAEKKRKEPVLKEVGTMITFYGVKYSDDENKKLIDKMARAIQNKARPIKTSPERPKVFIIEPRSAYDYG